MSDSFLSSSYFLCRKIYKFVFINGFMVRKTIRVTEEAYNTLVGLKKEKDSFSEVIIREVERYEQLLKYNKNKILQ